jgi:hypothetical protein
LIAPAIAAGTSSRIFPPLTIAICFTEDAALGGEYWTTYRRRANAYFEAGKCKEALQDALRANELFLQNSEVLGMPAIASAQAEHPVDFVRWSASYLRFEMPARPAYRSGSPAISR